MRRWVLSARVRSLPLLLLLAGVTGVCPPVSGETLDQVVNPLTTTHTPVGDMAGVIDDATEHNINITAHGGNSMDDYEMAIVTLRRCEGAPPGKFAEDLFRKWQLGKKGRENGVLLLLVMEPSPSLHAVTGDRIKGWLPDGRMSELLRTKALPWIRSGYYGHGLLYTVRAIGVSLYHAKGGGTGGLTPSGQEMPSLPPVEGPRRSFRKPLTTSGALYWLFAAVIVVLTGWGVWRVSEGGRWRSEAAGLAGRLERRIWGSTLSARRRARDIAADLGVEVGPPRWSADAVRRACRYRIGGRR